MQVEAQWLNSTKTYTRLIMAPDASAHLVTMPGWYWNAFDWMNASTEWSKLDFITVAWKTAGASEDGGFAPHDNRTENFIAALMEHIWRQTNTYIHQERGIVNDC